MFLNQQPLKKMLNPSPKIKINGN